jgi:hypothetical protein
VISRPAFSKAVCFSKIAALAPLQVQPLQIYYGIVGFAKAIILARAVQSIANIAQSHGLSDISPQNAHIENLCLKFQAKGVFQQFNDAIAPLGRVNYYDDSSMLQFVRKPFDLAASLSGGSCSLKDILARIPGLQASYQRTFSEDPACLAINFHHNYSSVQLRIDDPHLFRDKADLQSRIQIWRERYPWLDDWCLRQSDHAMICAGWIRFRANLMAMRRTSWIDQRINDAVEMRWFLPRFGVSFFWAAAEYVPA